MGGLNELICQSVGSSHDHKVVLHCPPCSRQGNWVMSIGEFGIEVGDYLLRRSMDRQGDISTRGRGVESHDQGRLCRSLHHRGKGGGSRARDWGGNRGSGRLGMGFRGGLGRGFLISSHQAKAESKEVQRSRSSSWGREGAVGGGRGGGGREGETNGLKSGKAVQLLTGSGQLTNQHRNDP